MTERVRKRLLDALGARRAVAQFTAGTSFEDYVSSPLLRSAFGRQVEILGEAMSQALQDDPSLADKIPEIRRVVGMRNRIIHGYDSVDDRIIWDVVQVKIPFLNAELARLTDIG